MTTNQLISARILFHIAQGKTHREALDLVCGAGTYDKLIGELYDALRAKAGK